MGIWKDSWNKAQEDRLTKMERKALEHSSPKGDDVFLEVVGNKEMMRLSSRGWSIVSHTPQGYGQLFDNYVMKQNRSELEFSLDTNF